MSTKTQVCYHVDLLPPKDQEWMLTEIVGDVTANPCFLGDEATLPTDILKGPTRRVAFNIDRKVYIETFRTVKCSCGTLFVTEEEMEKHL